MCAQGEDVNGIISLHKHITRLKTHIFLARLDSKYNNARSEILRKDPPLDLESSYAYIRRDHNQRQIMKEPSVLPDHAVLVAAQTRQPEVLLDHAILVAAQTRQPEVLPDHTVMAAAQTRPQFKEKYQSPTHTPVLTMVKLDTPSNGAMKL